MALRVGTSGWHYEHWRGIVYPEELPKARWLEAYAQIFDTVEVDGTFYRLPSSETFARWRSAVPRGFVFAPKMSRFATHMKKLREPERTVGRFLARARALGPALGPVLVQLPPRWRSSPARIDAFLGAAPRRIRFAVELRDPSWLNDEVLRVLRRRRAALVVHDLLPDHPREATADFVYLRLHGARDRPYAGTYSGSMLRSYARWIDAQLRSGRDAFVYFDNDAGGNAVRDAKRMRAMLERIEQAA